MHGSYLNPIKSRILVNVNKYSIFIFNSLKGI
nr:MAG TPA: hypothetical protein [Caudoviricetes sp.]